MKILYIASSSGQGGATIALVNLLSELHKNHFVSVVVPAELGVLCEKLDDMQIPYYVLDYNLNVYPRSRNPIKFVHRIAVNLQRRARAITLLKGVVMKFKPDIVHTNVGPLDIGYEVCRELNIPHVWHIREYQDLDFAMRFYPSKSSFIKKIHTNGNYNIAITKGLFEYWNLRCVDRVIYDGVFRKDRDNLVVCGEHGDYLLFVGRVEEAKGLDMLLRAFVRFCRMNNRYKLIVAGRYDPKSAYWHECRRLIEGGGIESRVDFLGERNDVYALMQGAKALIVPSRFEGFGFITTEAMYNNCLVVGRSVAGTAEQFDIGFRECGREIGFRFLTEDELLDAINRVVMGEGEYMRGLAKQVVEAKYGSELHAKHIVAYYEHILNSRKYGYYW